MIKLLFLLATLWIAGCTPKAVEQQAGAPSEDTLQTDAKPLLERSDEPSQCMGEPISDMMCTQQYDPVCGCNKRTYSNACTAKVAGVQRWTKGPCGPHPNE